MSTETSTDRGVPLPPMKFNLWGTVDEAKPLGESTRKMLSSLMGVVDDGAVPAKDVPVDRLHLTAPRLPEEDLAAFRRIVGDGHVTTADAQRAPPVPR